MGIASLAERHAPNAKPRYATAARHATFFLVSRSTPNMSRRLRCCHTASEAYAVQQFMVKRQQSRLRQRARKRRQFALFNPPARARAAPPRCSGSVARRDASRQPAAAGWRRRAPDPRAAPRRCSVACCRQHAPGTQRRGATRYPAARSSAFSEVPRQRAPVFPASRGVTTPTQLLQG